ncbi:MAG: hypothetical protein LEGION0398_MBIBDBAK_00774 [Legionellaceae bacterium]
MELIEEKGITLGEKIKKFIAQCRLGGQGITGEIFASLFTQKAYLEFRDYINLFSESTKKSILSLQGGFSKKTLNDILIDLNNGNCVEIAANSLQLILDNESNHLQLNTALQLSKQEKDDIQKKYKKPRTPNLVIPGYEINISIAVGQGSDEGARPIVRGRP